jgi:hypothetical protein
LDPSKAGTKLRMRDMIRRVFDLTQEINPKGVNLL